MPIYEYKCNSCGKRANIFFRSFSVVADPVCPHCQSHSMERLISKVAIIKTNQQRLERLADIERSGLNRLDSQTDPREIGNWARRVGAEFDEELGTNFREMAEQMSGDDRPPDLYSPVHSFRDAVRYRMSELASGQSEPSGGGDPWDQYIRETGNAPAG